MTNQKGYIALMTTLIVLAVALVVVGSVSLLSIGEAESGLALSKGEGSLFFVEGCMEDAILKIKINSSYLGGTITHPEGSCAIIVSQSGNSYTVTATTDNTTQYKRVIRVILTRTSSITVNSWQEI